MWHTWCCGNFPPLSLAIRMHLSVFFEVCVLMDDGIRRLLVMSPFERYLHGKPWYCSIFRSTPPTNDNNFSLILRYYFISFGRLDRNYMTTVYEKLRDLEAIPDIWFTRRRLTICGTSSGSLFWFREIFQKNQHFVLRYFASQRFFVFVEGIKIPAGSFLSKPWNIVYIS